MICVLGFATGAQAQDIRYVNDDLVIMMRSGAGNEYKILRTLKSGARLELLQTSEDRGYALARTESGAEGWVLTQYLDAQPPARLRLEEAQAKAAKLQDEYARLRQELDGMKQENSGAAREKDRLDGERQKLHNELQRLRQVAARPAELDAENQALKEEMARLKDRLRLAEEHNGALQDKSGRKWFVAGASVLLLGLIAGLVIPRIKWRKRSMWR